MGINTRLKIANTKSSVSDMPQNQKRQPITDIEPVCDALNANRSKLRTDETKQPVGSCGSGGTYTTLV
jgi:hypothetical protein